MGLLRNITRQFKRQNIEKQNCTINKQVVFYQDNAPAYTTMKVMVKLNEISIALSPSVFPRSDPQRLLLVS